MLDFKIIFFFPRASLTGAAKTLVRITVPVDSMLTTSSVIAAQVGQASCVMSSLSTVRPQLKLKVRKFNFILLCLYQKYSLIIVFVITLKIN